MTSQFFEVKDILDELDRRAAGTVTAHKNAAQVLRDLEEFAETDYAALGGSRSIVREAIQRIFVSLPEG